MIVWARRRQHATRCVRAGKAPLLLGEIENYHRGQPARVVDHERVVAGPQPGAHLTFQRKPGPAESCKAREYGGSAPPLPNGTSLYVNQRFSAFSTARENRECCGPWRRGKSRSIGRRRRRR